MSGTPQDEAPSGWDILAGEYVLGLLDAEAALSVEQRARAEPGLAAAIARWQTNLDPLADLAPPVRPATCSGSASPRICPSQPPSRRRRPTPGAALPWPAWRWRPA